MSEVTKTALLVLGTMFAAAAVQYGISAADPGMSWRSIIAHVIGAVGTSMGALFAKLPERKWTEQERAEKLNNGKEIEK